ncbi:MAG: hypothetical protein EOP51_21930 [Sphingobacteriales bacterium]|nr:MAG: hypothetical protein EOP51_21930 [Sphingobacteriales bacterium]
MKKLYFIFFLLLAMFTCKPLFAVGDAPDTVKAGIYITSIHDIDFKQREYNMSAWLWLKYKNPDFDFIKNLEVPLAKSVNKSFTTTDTAEDGEIYILMKLDCTMKDSWKVDNFPFDAQKLRFSIENSQFDSKALVFVVDTLGKHFDPKYTLRGWDIDSISLKAGTKSYETTFGDRELTKPHVEYSNFRMMLQIERDAVGLFWKMFLGMYVAFLIAFMCFFINVNSFDSRFSLSVGSLFAVVGNKYIVDSSLPESSTFTLVDALHGTTLMFILGIIICNTISVYYVRHEKLARAKHLDRIIGPIFFVVYAIINIYLIKNAIYAGQ